MFPSLPVRLKAWTLTHAMCAICSCLCGDRMAPNTLLFLLHRGKARASRLGRVQTADTGRGAARRHLRHNLYLTGQPLSPCTQQNYAVVKLEVRVCVVSWSACETTDWHFFQTRGQHNISFRCYFWGFSTSTSGLFCMFLLDDGTKSCDEGNKTCRRSGFGSRGDQEQKSCTIFKIANNEGGGWRDRVAFNLPRKLLDSNGRAADFKRYLVPQLEIQLFKLKVKEQHKRAIHTDFFTNYRETHIL